MVVSMVFVVMAVQKPPVVVACMWIFLLCLSASESIPAL